MNAKHQDELLNDIFGGEGVKQFRRNLLQNGLNEIRRRKRRRRLSRACLALVVAFGAYRFLIPNPEIGPAPVRVATLPVPRASVPLVQESSVEMIGDRELQELFPYKILALVGPPGDQRLLVLDGPHDRL